MYSMERAKTVNNKRLRCALDTGLAAQSRLQGRLRFYSVLTTGGLAKSRWMELYTLPSIVAKDMRRLSEFCLRWSLQQAQPLPSMYVSGEPIE